MTLLLDILLSGLVLGGKATVVELDDTPESTSLPGVLDMLA